MILIPRRFGYCDQGWECRAESEDGGREGWPLQEPDLCCLEPGMDLFLAIISLVGNSRHDHCPGQGGKEVEIDFAEPSSWGDKRLRAGPASVHKKRTGKLEKRFKKKKKRHAFLPPDLLPTSC